MYVRTDGHETRFICWSRPNKRRQVIQQSAYSDSCYMFYKSATAPDFHLPAIFLQSELQVRLCQIPKTLTLGIDRVKLTTCLIDALPIYLFVSYVLIQRFSAGIVVWYIPLVL